MILLAAVLIVLALMLDTVTLAGGNYYGVLLTSLCLQVAALVLLGIRLRTGVRSRTTRILIGGLTVITLLVGFDITGRLRY